MKLKGIFGKGSGKLGNAVFAVSGGEQLVKEYNPRVSNPNTPAQVEQRAKFKLLSQLAADLNEAIAYRKQGLVSSRNLFVRENIVKAGYSDGQASMPFVDIAVASGSVSIPSIEVGLVSEGNYSVKLSSAAGEGIISVAYFVYRIDGVRRLTLEKKEVVSTAGAGGDFPLNVELRGGQYVVFGYGILEKAEGAGADYENMVANGDDEEAQLDYVKKNIGKTLATSRSSATTYEV